MVTKLEDYQNKYTYANLERRDGILQVTFHTDGGTFVWSEAAHHELGYLWQDVGADPETKVIIVTGTGDGFIGSFHEEQVGSWGPARFVEAHPHAKRLTQGQLEIEQPMIAAVNGPAIWHGEIALMCDIVIATPTAETAEPHFTHGQVPGDGVQVVYPLLFGINRARHMMLTGRRYSAEECLQLGVYAEVLPPDQLVDRAWELARDIMKQPPSTVRLFRTAVLQHYKRLMLDGLSHGLMTEFMGFLDVMDTMRSKS